MGGGIGSPSHAAAVGNAYRPGRRRNQRKPHARSRRRRATATGRLPEWPHRCYHVSACCVAPVVQGRHRNSPSSGTGRARLGNRVGLGSAPAECRSGS